MEVKKIDGVEYIVKESVDELVRKRLSPMSERARKAETKVEELTAALDGSKNASSRIAEHQQRITELEEQIAKSRAQYQSHSTIAQHGFVDAHLRDMVEWTYQREMASRPKKNQQKLGDWLEHIKANPEDAPISIRPHIAPNNPAQPAAQPAAKTHNPAQGIPSNPPTAAPSNGVVQTNGAINANLLENALRAPDI